MKRLTPHPFAESLTESFDGLNEKQQTWVKNWFAGNDKGDWKNCYERMLKTENPNASKNYGKFSDSGKAWVCQREFNSLPQEIVDMVDKDKNDQWLRRRAEGWEGLDRLESQFSQEDRSGINTEDKGPDTKKPLTSTNESLNENWDGLNDDEQNFVRNWFNGAGKDKGDWEECYWILLKEVRNKKSKKGKNRASEVFNKFSPNAKKFVCQREFNYLPDDILETVDTDVNKEWLERRRKGTPAMNELKKDWTKYDMEHIDSTNTGPSLKVNTSPTKKTAVQKGIDTAHNAMKNVLGKAMKGATQAKYKSKGQ